MASLNRIKLPSGDYIDIDAKTLGGTAASSFITTATAADTYLPLSADTRAFMLYNPTADGVLVQTDCGSSATMLEFIIEGNAYAGGKVLFSRIQCYYDLPSNSFSQSGAINYGTDLGPFTVFKYNGIIYLWVARTYKYQTFRVSCYTQLNRNNRVVSVTSGAVPDSDVTATVTIIPYQSYNSNNLTQSVVTGLIGSSTYAPYNADGYLPLSGGTMSGNIVFAKSGSTTVGYPILALSSITGGWSRELYDVRYDDTRIFHIGVYGNASTLSYGFIGTTGYSGNNLRIYSDKVQFGDNVIWHAGNDGASSGLDADLLDGQHGSYYATASSLGNYLPLAGGTMTGDLVLGNAINIQANDSGGTARTIIGLNSSNVLHIGYSTGGQGYITRIYGGDIEFHYGTGRALGMTLGSDGKLVMESNIVLPNSIALQAKASDGTARGIAHIDASNNARYGYGTAGQGYNTYLHGNNVYLTYGTSRTTGLTLNSSGNVGIGTNSPANKLHVSGAGRFETSANIWSTISGAQINFNKLSTHTTGYNQGIRFRIADSSNTEISSKYLLGVYSSSAYQYMYLGGTYTDAVVRITDTGVGIKKGNANPSYALDVTGSINSTTGYYINGTKLPNITVSSSAPTSSDGSNGDVWIVTS